MKTILVTGGAGFIGSSFIKTVCKKQKDFKFIIIDALTYAGVYESIKDDVENDSNLEFRKVDIRKAEELAQFRSLDLTGIIHFAAETHVDQSIKRPELFVETNVMGTANLLSLALHFKSNANFRYVQVSTDEVYGSLTDSAAPFTEESQLFPSSPYSASKASADLLALSYFKTYGLPVIVTRSSNNYGPRQFPEKLIPLMISKASRNESLPVYGTGKNIRDWIFVDDHAAGVWAAFSKGRSGEIYNLGAGQEKQNIEIVRTILTSLGKPKSLINYVTDRPGHDWRYALNTSKANHELSWKATTKLEDGLKHTIAWYQSNQAWVDLASARLELRA